MRDIHSNRQPASTVYVGVDLHGRRWHVTAGTAEAELFSASIEGTWEALRRVLDRFRGHHVEVVYEAGYFDYWLHDRLVEYGAACVVTPPSLIPQEAGNRVKTDRLDSRKLALAQTELYRERVRILCSVPGVGLIAAMELLLELQDVARFRRADELAAYVGLTPSQHTSAEKVRMGRITKVGKGSLRAMLVEASWLLIRKDSAMRQTYERIKLRSGGKRAIVAVARSRRA